jgi:hypothetical protein
VFTSFLLPSVFEGVSARHLCVFYAQLGAFGPDQIAFIGEPSYFEEPSALERAGRPEWRRSWRDAYGYEPPVDLAGVTFRALPEDLFAARRSRVRSSWRLYGQLARRRLPELESAFSAALDSLDIAGPSEAVLLFANNPSVVQVARRRGIPVVHNEFGPLRRPAYVMTGYWDQHGVSRGSDARRRFREFRRELRADRVPLLGREEILYTLRRAPLPEVRDAGAARYRIGVALQGDDNACVQGVSALDVLSAARQRCCPEDILVRYHFGSETRYSATLGHIDS